MNHVERFRAVMNLQPVDRLPVWEWATWWDKTIDRWHGEGLPSELRDTFEISHFLGLDPYRQFWIGPIDWSYGNPGGEVNGMDDYLRLRPGLYPDCTAATEPMQPWARRQQDGEVVVWGTLEGFYWFPRTLMDVERLSYAFYDEPELLHAINRDLLEFNLRTLDQMTAACVPTFLTLAEDMSYNHGPLLNQAQFEEFLAPYYRPLSEALHERGIMFFIDTDGDPMAMIPWLQSVGVDGVLPLERQAGVDAGSLRDLFPDLRMVGHFDKMVMHLGDDALAAEFDRLRPAVKRGGFIPSVDHQTPPNVSLAEYRLYVDALKRFSLEFA